MISTYPDNVPPAKVVQCSNYFKIKENHVLYFHVSYNQMYFTGNENRNDVYHTTPDDNDTALSREDR